MRKSKPFLIQEFLAATNTWSAIEGDHKNTDAAVKAAKALAGTTARTFQIVQVCARMVVKQEMRPVTVVED